MDNRVLLTFMPLWPSFGGCRSQKLRKTGMRYMPLAVCGAGNSGCDSMRWVGVFGVAVTFPIVSQPSRTCFQPPFSGNVCTDILDFQGPAIHHGVYFIYSLTHPGHHLPAGSRPQWVLEIAWFTVLSSDKHSGVPVWGGKP